MGHMNDHYWLGEAARLQAEVEQLRKQLANQQQHSEYKMKIKPDIMSSYDKSVRRGELMMARYQMEHATFDRVADLVADIMAYCESKEIDFDEEARVARSYLDDEKAEQ